MKTISESRKQSKPMRRTKMKKQINQRWQSLLLATIAIVLAFGAFSGAAVAQDSKSISARYGSRDPRTCENTKAPARGAITAALAAKYLNCQMEFISMGDLYLVENVKVEVGAGFLTPQFTGLFPR